MRLEKEYITLPRGSDVYFEFPLVDDNDAPINMTGWTVALFEAGPDGAVGSFVQTNHTVAWSNQAGGVFEFKLPWDAASPEEFWIRLRLTRTADGHDDAIDQIWVRYT